MCDRALFPGSANNYSEGGGVFTHPRVELCGMDAVDCNMPHAATTHMTSRVIVYSGIA